MLFYCRCLLARLNETERALELLSVAVDQGYGCHYALSCHPWLDSLRSHPRFTELANRAEVWISKPEPSSSTTKVTGYWE